MTAKYILYSLDVGQGMCTFVASYDGKKLKSIALFDIGSSKSKSKIEAAIKQLESLIAHEQGDIYETIARIVLDVAALRSTHDPKEFAAQQRDVVLTIELLISDIKQLKHPHSSAAPAL